MNILILSCGTGGGHNDAARGIYEACLAQGHTATLKLDYLAMASGWVNDLVCNFYIKSVVICPTAFNLIYHFGRIVSTMNQKLNIKSPVYYMNGKMGTYIKNLLKQEEYDAIVMTHLYPAETITWLKQNGTPLPLTVGVETDYTSTPFWEETDCDYYIIPHEDCIKEFCNRGIPKHKLVPMGIPAPLAFEKREKSVMRERLMLKQDCKYILVMGGSMGAGSLPQFIEELYRAVIREPKRIEILVVCGKNDKLYRKMLTRWKNNYRIKIYPYIKNATMFMNACDLMYTKPGGLSATESAICQIPTIFLEPISECERKNQMFFGKHHLAVVPETRQEAIRQGILLLKSEDLVKKMNDAQKKVIPCNSANKIVLWLSKKGESC